MDGVRLAPRRPVPLASGSTFRLRLGNVELKFLAPDSFGEYLRTRSRLPSGG